MIRVFYSGHGYALRIKKDNYIDSQLKHDTLNEYHAYFCIEHGISERLKHFDDFFCKRFHQFFVDLILHSGYLMRVGFSQNVNQQIITR